MKISVVWAANELGTVKNPLTELGSPYGDIEGRTGAGLNVFLSNAMKLLIVVGGLFATINILLAGYSYITSNGDQQKVEIAGKRITYAALGLGVMVLSLIITGALSWIMFGDVKVLLQPGVWTP